MKPHFNQAQEWLLAVLLFFMTTPYFVWFTIIPTVSVIGFYLLTVAHYSPIKNKYRIGVFLFSIFYFFVAIQYGMELSMVYTIVIPLVFLMDSVFLCKGFDKFIKILSACLAISIIVYILVVFFNVSLPHTPYAPKNAYKVMFGFTYDQYPLLLLDPTNRGDILPRFYGIYDEPGVVGTICAIIMVTNQYNFKKKSLIPLFIAGFFSFSLFFYIITICYYIITLRRSNIVFTILFAVLIFFVLSKISGVEELVYNRFLIEDGRWLGDSRDKEGYGQWFSDFVNSSDFLLGLGPGANLEHNLGGASYKDIIVNYGFIMFLFYIVSLIVLIFNYSKGLRNLIICSIVIMGYVFQRPFITDVFMPISFLYILYKAADMDTNMIRA